MYQIRFFSVVEISIKHSSLYNNVINVIIMALDKFKIIVLIKRNISLTALPVHVLPFFILPILILPVRVLPVHILPVCVVPVRVLPVSFY